MKKFMSLLLALVLCFSLSVTAFAADTTAATPTEQIEITLDKVYTVSGATNLLPYEELSFTVTQVGGPTANITAATIKTSDLAFNEAGSEATGTLLLTLPSYSKAGVYTYTIAEDGETSQGATYASADIDLTVYVTYSDDGKTLVATPSVNSSDDGITGKNDTFNNSYAVGAITVKKEISGNLASADATFEMTVTLTAEEGKTVNSDITVSGGSDADNAQTIKKGWTGTEEVTIKLKAGETVTLANVPAGVSYEVEENSKHLLAEGTTVNPNSAIDTDYTVAYENESGKIESTETDAVTVTNTKNTSVATGITMDSMPYIVMLALVVVAGVLFLNKRRNAEY